jgi:hypothetical protein
LGWNRGIKRYVRSSHGGIRIGVRISCDGIRVGFRISCNRTKTGIMRGIRISRSVSIDLSTIIRIALYTYPVIGFFNFSNFIIKSYNIVLYSLSSILREAVNGHPLRYTDTPQLIPPTD